jgi:hypothetical protein
MAMKYTSNITKAFANGVCIIISTGISVLFFEANVNGFFLVAVFLVVFSVYMNTGIPGFFF